jgi:hypothetical protein
MKIILSYSSEHDKSEGIHYVNVLRRMGHEVVVLNVAACSDGIRSKREFVCGYPGDLHIAELLEQIGPAQLFLYIEPYGLIPQGMESAAMPTACVLSDCHLNLPSRISLGNLFDHVFIYQRNYLDAFKSHPSAHWMPYACDDDFFRDMEIPRDLDIGFVGQTGRGHTRRRKILDLLSSKYRVNEQRVYKQNEISEIYSRSKITVNIPIRGDLNFRFFEAISCGSLLLTERLKNGQEELFKENVHYVAYDSENELLEKVDYYLKNGDERLRIAQAGKDEALKNHTLEIRLQGLLAKILSPSNENLAPIRKMSESNRVRIYGSYYERAGYVNTMLKLAGKETTQTISRCLYLAFALKSFLRRTYLRW